MQADTRRRLLACLATVLLTAACSRDPKPGTPEAAAVGEHLMRSMSDTLAHSKTFSFETSERIELEASATEKHTLHFTRNVTVRRPNGMFFKLHGQDGTVFDVSGYYNGRTLTLSQNSDREWAWTTMPGTLDEMLDIVFQKFKLPVPIADVVYSSPYEAFLGNNSKGGFVGRESIDGVPCVKLDYSDPLVEVKLWIPASGPALPRRLQIIYERAAVPLISEINFTNWKLNVPVEDATFAFQPPVDRTPAEFSDFVAGLVSLTVPSERQATPQAAEAVGR